MAEIVYTLMAIYFAIGLIQDFIELIYRALKRRKRGK